MIIADQISSFGSYVRLMGRVFTRPDRFKLFAKSTVREYNALVIDSIGIVCLISLFIGAVCCIQIQSKMFSPLLPRYTLGFTTREILILEFSSSIIALILAGKVGSNIASEIGTMRITEQIDALDIMGVNSANYLILPKIVALVVGMPMLGIFSIFLGLIGGGLIAQLFGTLPISDYVYGIQSFFEPSSVWYSLKKCLFYGFLISSIASYFGYTVKGGATQVGKAATDSVVVTSVMVLLWDIILTKILI